MAIATCTNGTLLVDPKSTSSQGRSNQLRKTRATRWRVDVELPKRLGILFAFLKKDMSLHISASPRLLAQTQHVPGERRGCG